MNQSSERSRAGARHRYETFVAAVDRAIAEADPKCLLDVGCATDEYSLEVGTIVPRVARAQSREEVRAILHDDFQRRFGEGEAGVIEAWDVPANTVWQAVLTLRRRSNTPVQPASGRQVGAE